MNRQAPAPRSQGADRPRPLSRSVSPLILDIRDEGPAFSRRPPRAPAAEGPLREPRPAPSPPASGRGPQSLLILVLCAAVAALACLLYLDHERIRALEAELQRLTGHSTTRSG